MRESIVPLIAVFIGAVCAAGADPERKSVKGWELYVWKGGGDTHYALLAGTNRLKSAAEIEKAAVDKLDRIEKDLAGLPAKQDVTVLGHSRQERPPKEDAQTLVDYGKEHSLTMRVGGKR